ncbi:MAG: T9SS type A sorting domain-containing protein [Bacteroidales bacterium]|nr:T9SS type A sorting domain-containing protein [Bacteroidales bacterium]
MKEKKYSSFILTIAAFFILLFPLFSQPPFPPDYYATVTIASAGPNSADITVGPSRVVYIIQLSVTGSNSVTLDTLTLKTSGTYNLDDLYSGAEDTIFTMYYNTVPGLIGSKLLAQQKKYSSGDLIKFTHLQFAFTGTKYLILTADIDNKAVNNHTIGVDSASINNFGFKEKINKVGPKYLAAGGLQKIKSGLNATFYFNGPAKADFIKTGSANNILYSIKIAGSVYPNTKAPNLKAIIFKTAGNYIDTIDFVPKSIKLWYSTASNLSNGFSNDNATLLKTAPSIPQPGDTILFDNLNLNVARNYFLYVTIDLSQNVINNNYIHIINTPFSAFIFYPGGISLSGPNPINAGSIQTLVGNEYIEISKAGPDAKIIYTNTNKNILYKLKFNTLNVYSDTCNITEIKFKFKGTYNKNDFKKGALCLWASTQGNLSNGFGSDPVKLGTSMDLPGQDTIVSFSDFKYYPKGSFYFYLTLDIPAEAVDNQTILVAPVPFEDIIFSGKITKTGYNPAYSGGVQTIRASMYIDLSNILISSRTVGAASANVELYRIRISVSDPSIDATLNSIRLKTGGSYSVNDLLPNSIKLWYSTQNNSLSNAFQISSPINIVKSGDELVWNDLNRTIPRNSVVYIVVTGDISPVDIVNNYSMIFISPTPFDNINFAEPAIKTNNNPMSASGAITILTQNFMDFSVNLIPYFATKNPTDQNVILYQTKMTFKKVLNIDLTLNEIKFTTEGTYQTGDIKPGSFKLWVSTLSNLPHHFNETMATLLSKTEIVPTQTEFLFTNINYLFNASITRYFYVTADISSGASSDNVIKINPTIFSDYRFDKEITKTLSDATLYPFVAGAPITISGWIWKSDAQTNEFNKAFNWSKNSVPDDYVSATIKYYPAQPVIISPKTGAFDLYNLTLDMGSSLTVNGSTLNVTNNLIIKEGAMLTLNSADLLLLNNVYIEEGAYLVVNSPCEVYIRGDFSNSGSKNIGTGTIIFDGKTPQNITGNMIFNNVIMNNPTEILINEGDEKTNFTVKSILRVKQGHLKTGNRLTLYSDDKQTAIISSKGEGEISGKVTCQRYNPGVYGYHYISMPVYGASVSEIRDDIKDEIVWGQDYSAYKTGTLSNLWYYNETNVSKELHPEIGLSTDEQLKMNGWIAPSGPQVIMDKMKGYSVVLPAGTGLEVSGEVNNGDITANLTYTNSGNHSVDGWNLVGNPYPSFIDIEAAEGWHWENVDKAIYFLNSTSKSEGEYYSYINGISNPSSVSSLISPFQGFWVKVSGNSTGSGKLSLNNKARTDDINTSFYKKKNSKDNRQLLRLRCSQYMNSSIFTETVIYFEAGATEFFDTDKDAYKIMSTDGRPDIFTLANSKKLSINGMPALYDKQYDVAFECNVYSEEQYQLEVAELVNFPEGSSIILEDKLLNYKQDLTNNTFYKFSAGISSQQGRFVLHFIPLETNIKQNKEFQNALIYLSGRELIIDLKAKEIAVLSIYDITGKQVYADRVLSSGKHNLELQLHGVYFAKLLFSNGSIIKKLIIE